MEKYSVHGSCDPQLGFLYSPLNFFFLFLSELYFCESYLFNFVLLSFTFSLVIIVLASHPSLSYFGHNYTVLDSHAVLDFELNIDQKLLGLYFSKLFTINSSMENIFIKESHVYYILFFIHYFFKVYIFVLKDLSNALFFVVLVRKKKCISMAVHFFPLIY